ncbi:hypothetical protein HNY73_013135 [Argiope bruennichi]|uniref:Uncharacterized protein n=1 Tax=Argiope bruennichi TaxID=94029 RepID=A0A8T0F2Z5_ARGBR|nr:hypothetical protein HNY73_013135 [Argiope bruennichi]
MFQQTHVRQSHLVLARLGLGGCIAHTCWWMSPHVEQLPTSRRPQSYTHPSSSSHGLEDTCYGPLGFPYWLVSCYTARVKHLTMSSPTKRTYPQRDRTPLRASVFSAPL